MALRLSRCGVDESVSAEGCFSGGVEKWRKNPLFLKLSIKGVYISFYIKVWKKWIFVQFDVPRLIRLLTRKKERKQKRKSHLPPSQSKWRMDHNDNTVTNPTASIYRFWLFFDFPGFDVAELRPM